VIESLPFSAGVTAGGITSLVAALIAAFTTPTPTAPPAPTIDAVKPARVWSRAMTALLLLWFLSNAGISGYNAFYPLVMLHEFRVSPTAASFALSAASAVSTLVFVWAAALLRRLGSIRLLLSGLGGRFVLLVVLSVLSYMEFTGRPVLALFLFSWVTLLWPLISVSATVLVADLSVVKGRGLGYFDSAAAMAHLAGPVLAGYLATRYGYEAVIILATAGVGVSLLLSPYLKAE
jgi:predicted MFS family arabinose efflux permease